MADPVPFDIAERQQALAQARAEALQDAPPDGPRAVIAHVTQGLAERALALIDAGTPMGNGTDHALLAAARTNRGHLMHQLVERGAPFHAMAADIYCAAAAAGALALLKVLAREADPDAADGLGWPPLFHAAVNGQWMAVEYLLDAGADRSVRDPQGFTAAERAVRAGQRGIADLLHPLALPKDLDARSPAAIDDLFIEAARLDRPSAFERLVHAGADLAALGGEALCAAAGAGALNAARRLLTLEVPVTARGRAGKTALEAAARVGSPGNRPMVALLLDWGAEGDVAHLKAAGFHGSAAWVAGGIADRALFKAVWNDDPAAVRAAIAEGADANARTCFPVTYLGGRRYEGSDTPLIRAAATGRPKAAAELLQAPGIELDAESGLPFDTALMRAVNFGQQAIALMLADAGADPRRPGRLTGQSPLEVAVERGDLMLIGRFKRWR